MRKSLMELKKSIIRRKNNLKKYGVSEQSYLWSENNLKKKQKKRLYSKKYTFIDRSKGSENLLLILAGFQSYYWEAVFERVKENQNMFSESIDICVCVPGENGKILSSLAEKYGWSYLRIPKDLLAQVQNTAIKLHPKADWIFKIDEDILISDNYFAKLKKTYEKAELKLDKEIGFVAPLINLNACGVKIFLNTIGKYESYEKHFGKMILGMEEPIHRDPKVGEWIWNQSIPFDEIAKKIENKNRFKFSECSIRFSIGAILIKRSFWNKLGGFLVKNVGYMGGEEEQINSFCINQMMSIVISEDTFAGHLGFFHQKEECHKFFDENQESIRLSKID